MGKVYDVIVLGGGQSALAVAYYLRRSGLDFLLLDKEPTPGGSWQYAWDSLSHFSLAQWSSLPGMIAPGGAGYYPSRDETITYLRNYEQRYCLPVERSVEVTEARRDDDIFLLETSRGTYQARAVVNATDSFTNPIIPAIEGREEFGCVVMHSSQYRSLAAFVGQRVAVVGEGNSGAQILAELSRVADTLWVTPKPPSFLPDEVDGR
ncbi:flavin-containing monooxygenase [Chitinophaga cymbidii]|nr:NAD(P)/FAD-dependent oxidoreductase [Chitinophaga cymbidii]